MNPFSEIKTLFQFYKYLKTIQPDVLHLFTIKPVLYGSFLSLFSHIQNTVVTITGLGYLFMRPGFKGQILRLFLGTLYKIFFIRSKIKIIFQNNDDYQLFVNASWVRPDQACIIPGTGVDILKFSPTKKANTKIIIVFPARLLKDKGVVELVEAGREIYKKNINFEIWLCGEIDLGNPSSISETELNTFSQEPFVKALGYCHDMVSVYRDAHIVCLPSYREGIPLSLLEACACGLPIVTTNVPGCREAVSQNENGFLVPAKNSQQLAQYLEQLIHSESLREKMGHASRRIAENKFAKDVVIEQNLQVYGLK